jgi:intein-encoded DNA endonuclease-like protein
MKNEHSELYINLGIVTVIACTCLVSFLTTKPRELPLEDVFEAYARGYALGFVDGRDSVTVPAVES